MKKPRCALVIGHKPTDGGAENRSFGVCEYSYNEELARLIATHVTNTDVTLVYRKTGISAMASEINAMNPDFVVSLHADGAENPKATGSEVWYWHSSAAGKAMAQIALRWIAECLGLPSRGIKSTKSGDRAAGLISSTQAPTILCEPFFITSVTDCALAIDRKANLAKAYAGALDEISMAVFEYESEPLENGIETFSFRCSCGKLWDIMPHQYVKRFNNG